MVSLCFEPIWIYEVYYSVATGDNDNYYWTKPYLLANTWEHK